MTTNPNHTLIWKQSLPSVLGNRSTVVQEFNDKEWVGGSGVTVNFSSKINVMGSRLIIKDSLTNIRSDPTFTSTTKIWSVGQSVPNETFSQSWSVPLGTTVPFKGTINIRNTTAESDSM